MKNELG